jgi:hypothetical protein
MPLFLFLSNLYNFESQSCFISATKLESNASLGYGKYNAVFVGNGKPCLLYIPLAVKHATTNTIGHKVSQLSQPMRLAWVVGAILPEPRGTPCPTIGEPP